jgi:methylated-DNA-[protein]-cysteine S-methyltransferase
MVNAVIHDSPVGPLTLVSDGAHLVGVHFEGWIPPAAAARASDEVLVSAGQQLNAYFAGRLRRFDLPLGLSGTPFQQRVWSALQNIPFGETRSYAQLAEAIGSPPRRVRWGPRTARIRFL